MTVTNQDLRALSEKRDQVQKAAQARALEDEIRELESFAGRGSSVRSDLPDYLAMKIAGANNV